MKHNLGLTTLTILTDGGRHFNKITVKHYWRGGCPGAETDWNHPQNWYNRNVPGWFDEVVIAAEHTKYDYFPSIDVFVNDVAQLIVEEGGKLFIGQHGRLSIDGLGKKGLGIMNDGEIYVQGELSIQRTTFASVRNKGLIYNTGSLAIDQSETKGVQYAKLGNFVNFGEFIYL